MQKWLVNNFWLKVISLAMAVITWFYISGELVKGQAGFYPRPTLPSPDIGK